MATFCFRVLTAGGWQEVEPCWDLALIAVLWGLGLPHGCLFQTAPSLGARRWSWGGAPPEDWGWSWRRTLRNGYMESWMGGPVRADVFVYPRSLRGHGWL